MSIKNILNMIHVFIVVCIVLSLGMKVLEYIEFKEFIRKLFGGQNE